MNYDELTDDVSRTNYAIVKNVIESKTLEVQEIMYNIIIMPNDIAKNIELISCEKECNKKFIWTLFEKITRELATERGLM